MINYSHECRIASTYGRRSILSMMTPQIDALIVGRLLCSVMLAPLGLCSRVAGGLVMATIITGHMISRKHKGSMLNFTIIKKT